MYSEAFKAGYQETFEKLAANPALKARAMELKGQMADRGNPMANMGQQNANTALNMIKKPAANPVGPSAPALAKVQR